jgi:hypothetical protein
MENGGSIQVYEGIVSGKISLEDFILYLNNLTDAAFAGGFMAGQDEGYVENPHWVK